MSFRVTRANMRQLVEAMGEVTTAWENAEESITTWIEYQDTPPTDEDGRDGRREARAAIESEVDALRRSLEAAARLLRARVRP
jgi:hypothetical protein